MQKFNLKLINPIFFMNLRLKVIIGLSMIFINTTIGRSHRSKDKKKKLIFVKDKSKEILALTIEWSYEGVHNNYA